MKLDTIRYWDRRIGKNKWIEFQVCRWAMHKHTWLGGQFNIKRKGVVDHHGIEVELILFGYSFYFDFADIRHKEDV